MWESIDAKKLGLRFLAENFQTMLVNSYWNPAHTFLCWRANVDLGPIRAFMCCLIHWDLHHRYTQHHSLQPMTKQSNTLASQAETTAQTLCLGPEQWLLRALPPGHPGGPVRGAERMGAALSGCSMQVSCTGALSCITDVFLLARFICFQDQLCTVSSRNFVGA